MIEFLRKIIHKYRYSSESYLNFLKKSGAKIGSNCFIYSPQTVTIDISRPYLLEFGNNVILTKNVTILTHDYSHTVIRKKYGIQYGDAKNVKIGNNVFVGIDSLILMGSTIGNNVIIGAKSVVRGSIPDNVVVSGNPAKVVCSIEEFRNKREKNCLSCAVKNVISCRKNIGRNPTIDEMGDAFAWLYLPRTKENIKKYHYFFSLPGDDSEDLTKHFLETKPVFESYEKFLEYVDSNADL